MATIIKAVVLNMIITACMTLCQSVSRAETIEYDGLIEPYVVIDIGAPDKGIVDKVLVDRGSRIGKGQVLVELESSAERAVFEKARTMAAFDGEIKLQKTQLDYTQRVDQRIQKLAVIPAQEKDQAATEAKLTAYLLKKAHEKRILAEKELQEAWVSLDRRSVKSPISGVVVERYVSPGEYVNNQPLLQIAQIDPLRVEVIVPSCMFGRITDGMTAAVFPELERYGEQTAAVTIVDKVIDSASSTFRVRLELPNAEQQIPSGLRCIARFEIDLEPAAPARTSARFDQAGGSY